MSRLVGYPYQFSPSELSGWRRHRRALAGLSCVAFLGIIALVAYLYVAGSSGISSAVLGFMGAFSVIGCVNSYLLGGRGAQFRSWDSLGLVLGQGILCLMMMVATNPGYWTAMGASVVFLLVGTYAITCVTSPGTLYGASGSALVLVSGLNSLLLVTLVARHVGPASSPAGHAVRILFVLLGVYAVFMGRRTVMVYQMALQGVLVLGVGAGAVAAESSVRLIFIPILATILVSGSFLTLAVRFPPVGFHVEQALGRRTPTGHRQAH